MRAHTASAKRIGITDEQIQALLFYHRSQLFDEKDKAVIHFADQVTRAAATIRETHLQELRKHFSEEQVIELALTTCVANFTNRVNDSLISSPDLGT
jgi:alkylhydroperoxidase family enzyme